MQHLEKSRSTKQCLDTMQDQMPWIFQRRIVFEHETAQLGTLPKMRKCWQRHQKYWKNIWNIWKWDLDFKLKLFELIKNIFITKIQQRISWRSSSKHSQRNLKLQTWRNSLSCIVGGLFCDPKYQRGGPKDGCSQQFLLKNFVLLSNFH